jgi:hypothetical protein
MSLATLNKQRSVEKQSIRTTVTISKVSKTPIMTTTTAPITSQSNRKDELPGTFTETVKASHESPSVEEETVIRKKELAKEKFFSSSIDDAATAEQRRGMLFNQYTHIFIIIVVVVVECCS